MCAELRGQCGAFSSHIAVQSASALHCPLVTELRGSLLANRTRYPFSFYTRTLARLLASANPLPRVKTIQKCRIGFRLISIRGAKQAISVRQLLQEEYEEA